MFLFSIIILILVVSCKTTGTDHSEIAAQTSVPTDHSDTHTLKNTYPDPVEIPGVINFTDPQYRCLWNTVPQDGKLVVFASTPRREFRKEEILYCVKDAARQIALFSAAKIETKQAVESTGKDFGYLESVKSGFDKSLADKEVSKIKVLKHFRDAEGTYILAEDPDISVLVDFSWTVKSGKNPEWIINVPSIPGYLVSVGVVQRSQYLTNSLKKADDQALANLSRQISINVKSTRTDIEVENSTAYAQTHYEVSSTILEGFYVLGRWSEDHGNTFFTLAVCKQGIGN